MVCLYRMPSGSISGDPLTDTCLASTSASNGPAVRPEVGQSEGRKNQKSALRQKKGLSVHSATFYQGNKPLSAAAAGAHALKQGKTLRG